MFIHISLKLDVAFVKTKRKCLCSIFDQALHFSVS